MKRLLLAAGCGIVAYAALSTLDWLRAESPHHATPIRPHLPPDVPRLWSA
jgi:hypothetical protein